jgi:hypothetical protein
MYWKLCVRCNGCRCQDQLHSSRGDPIRRLPWALDTLRFPDERFSSQLFLGVELEMCFPPDVDRTNVAHGLVHAVPGMFVIKPECTTSNGFELVTFPLTLREHLDTGLWATVCSRMVSERAYVSDQVGLHVHCSKRFLGDAGGMRLIRFFTNSDYRPWIRNLSGRPVYSHCSFEYANHVQRHRYVAINCLPPNTVEFRFFGSTLDPRRLVTILKFVTLCCNLAVRPGRMSPRTLREHAKVTGDVDLVEFVAGGNQTL